MGEVTAFLWIKAVNDELFPAIDAFSYFELFHKAILQIIFPLATNIYYTTSNIHPSVKVVRASVNNDPVENVGEPKFSLPDFPIQNRLKPELSKSSVTI
jgi:hypothetical protein